MPQTVSAVFESNTSANRAIQNLIDAGIPHARISTVMSRATRERYYPETEAADGAGWGAGVGAALGGLIAVASLGVPGGIFVGGPLAALIGGAAVGAVGGGMLGALVDSGVPEEHARSYEERVQRGGIVVAAQVDTPEEARRAEQALLKPGGPTPRETLVVTETRP